MAAPLKYVADVSHVREVALLGTANLAYWREHLAAQDLMPVEQDGKSQVLIISAEMRFMGLRFRELSFSILVSGPSDVVAPEGAADGAYLVQAFNSRRFLAFCERVFFSTPYYHADVRVTTELPASIRLMEDGEAVFVAQMRNDTAAPPREPSRAGDDGWQ